MKTIPMKVTAAYLIRLAQENEEYAETVREINSRIVEEKKDYFILK